MHLLLHQVGSRLPRCRPTAAKDWAILTIPVGRFLVFEPYRKVSVRVYLLSCLFALGCNGCAVVAVADAAVTVVATTVKVGATVVGATVDVAAAGVKAVAGSDEEKN